MITRNVILAVDDAIVSGGYVQKKEIDRERERESSEIPAMELKWLDQARRREARSFLIGIYRCFYFTFLSLMGSVVSQFKFR